MKYEKINTMSSYAPWLSDKLFLNTFNKVKKESLVDLYRCYGLWDIIHNLKDTKGDLIEVGVWKGASSIIIAQALKKLKSKSKFYMCDTFCGVVKSSNKDTIYKNGEHSDTSLELVQNKIDKFNFKNIKVLKGIFPEETSKFIKSKTIKFIHIDVDVYNSAKDIVNWVWPKLVKNGIIVFDDYGSRRCSGITKYVNKLKKEKDKFVFYNLNGQAIVIKNKLKKDF